MLSERVDIFQVKLADFEVLLEDHESRIITPDGKRLQRAEDEITKLAQVKDSLLDIQSALDEKVISTETRLSDI